MFQFFQRVAILKELQDYPHFCPDITFIIIIIIIIIIVVVVVVVIKITLRKVLKCSRNEEARKLYEMTTMKNVNSDSIVNKAFTQDLLQQNQS